MQNDGNAPDTMTVRGASARPGTSLTYSVGGHDITRQMLSFKGKTFTLDAAETVTIKVVVRVKSSATVGKVYGFKAEAYSLNDLEREDVVAAKITAGR